MVRGCSCCVRRSHCGEVLTRWRWRREQIAFALILMWLPPLAQLAISYLFIPMDVTRYVLPSFIAFYILAALGIAALGSARCRRGTGRAHDAHSRLSLR